VGREELERLAGQSRRVARDRERGDPVAGMLPGPREDGVEVGVGGIGDPQLLTREAIAAVGGLR
jgi:hypothetical protein